MWLALEAAENGEFIARCVNTYQPPTIIDPPGDVQVGIVPCEPFCAGVALINLSETQAVDMGKTEFILEGFPVQCVGLPASIEPGQEVRCTIKDFVTEGFQVVNWYGFSSVGDNGWGFWYPFEG